jgi:hypothetical protein
LDPRSWIPDPDQKTATKEKFHKIVNNFIYEMLKKKNYGFGIVDAGSEIRDLRLECGGHNIASYIL